MSKQSALSVAVIAAVCIAVSGCATSTSSSKASQSAESSFRAGEELYAKKKYADAVEEWKKVKESSYSPELSALAQLKIGDALYDDEKYIEAAAEYENFRKLHPHHESSIYALYRLGMSNYKQIGTIDVDQTPVKNSVTYFESFLKQYPTSPYATEVRENLADCRLKMVQYEIYVGRFYFRSEKYPAAIKRFETTLEKSPSSPANDEALLYLGESYTLSGNRPKGKEAFDRLAKEFPASPANEEAKKFMKKNF